MKTKKNLTALALLLSSQGMWAQYSLRGNAPVQSSYNKWVSQYASCISKHSSSCYSESAVEGAVYGGLMKSGISGNEVGENKNLFGLNAGLKYTYLTGRSCIPVQFELNGYVDFKFATFISSEDNDCEYTDYAAQIAVTPGIRISRFSIDCGPYIGYMGFQDSREEMFYSPNVSGLDYGLRMGCALHFEEFELGLHYDLGLSDHSKQFKKNDLMLTFAYKFKSTEL